MVLLAETFLPHPGNPLEAPRLTPPGGRSLPICSPGRAGRRVSHGEWSLRSVLEFQGSYIASSKDGFPGISAIGPFQPDCPGDRRPSVPRDPRCGGSSTLVRSAIERWDDGTGRLLIERSKTGQTGEGEVVFITHRAMTALDELRHLRGDASPSVFVMTAKTINRRVKAACLGEGFSGHSGRVGLARRMDRAGAPDSAIMRQGR